MEVYEYIYEKYPSFLANNCYADNIYYQNFLLTSENNRKKLAEKIKTNSKDIKKGDTFIAIKNVNTDGHDFIEE